MKSKLQFCEEFGFDQAAIDQRLRLFELEKSDEELAVQFRDLVMEPNVAKIVYNFYSFLFRHKEFSTYLSDEQLDSVKKTQISYLLTLGIDLRNL